jgi:hypothetical protein
MKIKHCRQRGRTDCGIAVCSMVTGWKYEACAAVAPPKIVPWGTPVKRLVEMIESLTGERWVAVRGKRWAGLLTGLEAEEPMIWLIRNRINGWKHLIIRQRSLVYCSEMDGPCEWEDYPLNWWRPTTFVLPPALAKRLGAAA